MKLAEDMLLRKNDKGRALPLLEWDFRILLGMIDGTW
jgi:hypothetical protein